MRKKTEVYACYPVKAIRKKMHHHHHHHHRGYCFPVGGYGMPQMGMMPGYGKMPMGFGMSVPVPGLYTSEVAIPWI